MTDRSTQGEHPVMQEEEGTRDGTPEPSEEDAHSDEAEPAPPEQPRHSTGLRLIGELCQPGVNWEYVLRDERFRSVAGYLANPFTWKQCNTFFVTIQNNTKWSSPGGMPRGTAWMVKPECTCSYGYGGHVVQPQSYPPWMEDIMKVVMPYFGIYI